MNISTLYIKISFINLTSKILGFIRDIIIAKTFGAGIATDAFFVALKLPNSLRHIFAEGIFSQVLIPKLAEFKEKKSKKFIFNFISCVSGVLILILILIIILGIIIAPWIIKITAPGFADVQEKFVLTIYLLRIVFPYILLISLTNFIGSILNTWNYFLLPAIHPILMNFSMIIFTLLSYLFNQPILSLAISILIGGLLQFSSQLLQLNKIKMLVFPCIKYQSQEEIKCIFKLMLPAIIAMSISQISNMINTIFSSFLSSGSVSCMYYAERIVEFPSGVLGSSLSTILLPILSNIFSNGNKYKYSYILDNGLRICFLLILPSAIALAILAKPIVITFFHYGNFSLSSVKITQQSLTAYSIGLIGFVLVKILTLSFYSSQDIKTPMYTRIVALVITQILNLILVKSLKHIGLALSIGLGACINAILLYWQLRKKKLFQPQAGWLKFFLRILLALVVMTIVLKQTFIFLPGFTQNNIFLRLLKLIIIITLGSSIYFFTLRLTGIKSKDFILNKKF